MGHAGAVGAFNSPPLPPLPPPPPLPTPPPPLPPPQLPPLPPPFSFSPGAAAALPSHLRAIPEPQWIQADLRTFDLSLLGQFGVIMADPPWDIHMDLPYGRKGRQPDTRTHTRTCTRTHTRTRTHLHTQTCTLSPRAEREHRTSLRHGTMADAEMRALRTHLLQTHGYLFLWVTGRAGEGPRTHPHAHTRTRLLQTHRYLFLWVTGWAGECRRGPYTAPTFSSILAVLCLKSGEGALH